MYLRYENVSVSIHKPPCNRMPLNRYYITTDTQPTDASIVTVTNHIELAGGGYITTEEKMTYGEWLKLAP